MVHVVHLADGGAVADWNLAATWVTAGATVGLLVGAFFTVRYAVKAFRAQSEDLGLAREQAERDIKERRRAQSAEVFTQITKGIPEDAPVLPGNPVLMIEAKVSNSSPQPVYDVRVQFELGDGPFGNPEPVAVLMPGRSYEYTRPWTRGLGLARLGATLEFRDAAGLHWRTNDRGELAEQ
jgi:hypothetical protein